MNEEQQSTATDQAQAVAVFIQQLYRGCPRVIVIPVILLMNVLVFLYLLFQGAAISGGNLSVYIDYGANLGALTKTGQWWRLFSAMFIHYGILHLAFNMWVLWDAGRLTERLYGHFNFAWIYLFSGLFASLTSLYWNMDEVASMGASGAVFGVFGALIGYLLREKRTMPGVLQKQLLRSALIFTAVTLFLGFTIPAIDNAAHLGGLISGLIMGVLLAKPLTHRRPLVVPAVTAHAGSIALLVLAIILAPAAYYDYHAQKQAENIIRGFIDEERELVKEWKSVVDQLQSGESFSESIVMQQLAESSGRWAKLIDTAQAPGQIQPETTRRIALLKEYAGYRASNTHLLTQFLQAPDEAYLEQVKQNNDAIRQLLQQLNTSISE